MENIIELLNEVTSLRQQIAIKDEKIKSLNQQILLLQRRTFGRRSEKQLMEYEAAWPTLFSHLEGEDSLKEEEGLLVTITKEVEEEAVKRRTTTEKEKKQITRKYKLPDNIRHEECVLEPEGVDVSSMVRIGEDVTEKLMYTPAEFWVKRIIRPIYKSKVEDENANTIFYQHPQLQNFLEGCMADNSLISQIIIDKFQYHLPEYRQKERFKALGVDLTPSTINRWVHKVADKLFLLYKLQMDDVLDCDYIQVDETTQKILDKLGKSRAGYVWVVRSPIKKSVFYYYYNGSRSQEVVLKLLLKYQGALQTDGYSVYNIYEQKQGVLPLGCLAHVRRKFENALEVDPKAQKALDYIALLYTIEANLKARGADAEQIRLEREEKSYPILKSFEAWMFNESIYYTPKSLMAKAMGYAFSMLPKISRYCSDGRYEIDNNSIERAVRPVTLGRKNYMFSGNNKGAEDNAIFYTFITTCKELDIEPIEWFNFALSNITDNTTQEELKKFLPKNFKK